MAIAFIPVLEIFPPSVDIGDAVLPPNCINDVQSHREWDRYFAESLKFLGYSDMAPVGSGQCLYPTDAFTQSDLEILAAKHFRDLELNRFIADRLSGLEGGFVLRVDGQRPFYPQCCGQLSDIRFWYDLVNGQNDERALYMMSGHPAPLVKFDGDSIIFDFSQPSSGEAFAGPDCPGDTLRVDFFELKCAIHASRPALKRLAAGVKRLNRRYGLRKRSDALWQKLIYARG